MSKHAQSHFAAAQNASALELLSNAPLSHAAATYNGDSNIVGTIGDDVLTGGNGNDSINGLAGNDVLTGGNGNDTLIGGVGVDHLLGGRGDDVLVWNQGDGSDFLDGGKGTDTMLFNGFANAESFTLSAKVGGGLLFTRDLGAISMDLTSVEKITRQRAILSSICGWLTWCTRASSERRPSGDRVVVATRKGAGPR